VVALQSSPPRASSHLPGTGPYEPLVVKPVTGARGVTSVNVTVESRSRGASLQIQVLRSDAPGAGGASVYQQQVPMTDVASPTGGPPGAVARASWSGVLSPTTWTGGCQNSLYRIVAQITDPSGTAHTFKGQWFRCSATGHGPTGGRIGHRTGYFDDDNS
jgi:hypothetical protein